MDSLATGPRLTGLTVRRTGFRFHFVRGFAKGALLGSVLFMVAVVVAAIVHDVTIFVAMHAVATGFLLGLAAWPVFTRVRGALPLLNDALNEMFTPSAQTPPAALDTAIDDLIRLRQQLRQSRAEVHQYASLLRQSRCELEQLRRRQRESCTPQVRPPANRRAHTMNG